MAAAGGGALRVAPYRIKQVGVVSTLLPGLAPKVVEKTLRVTAERLAPAGAAIIAERRVPHDEAALAAAIKELLGLGAELVIVFGASAIADRRDVIPAAITEIGGAIEHFGMPVDPGNLLLIGSAGGVPVLGAPGCARSPVENGFDWVLMRLLAGLQGHARRTHRHGRRRTVDGDRHAAAAAQPVRDTKATAMSPRSCSPPGARPGWAVPTSCWPNSTASRWCGSSPSRRWPRRRPSVIVVTGHQAELVEQALAGLKVKFVRNPDFAGGLASSVKAGIAAVPDNADGAVICLGDMPLIDAAI